MKDIWNWFIAILLILLGIFIHRKLAKLERVMYESAQKSEMIKELTNETGPRVLEDHTP